MKIYITQYAEVNNKNIYNSVIVMVSTSKKIAEQAARKINKLINNNEFLVFTEEYKVDVIEPHILQKLKINESKLE
jgi:hypothetical protein